MKIRLVDMDGLIGTITIMELKENVGASMQTPMVYISKQKTESWWRKNDRQTKEDTAADAERAPGGAGLSGGHDRAGDFGQMLLGRSAGGAGGGGIVRDIARVKT